MVTKFLDPKNDYAFKRIFGTEKNKQILVHFLNDILAFPKGEQIQQVTFLKPMLDPDVISKKQSIVDVLCVDEKGVQYIIEMQVARSEEELRTYESEKKSQLDSQAMLSYAKKEGLVEGRMEGLKEAAKNMLAQGLDPKTICAVTGLSPSDFENL